MRPERRLLLTRRGFGLGVTASVAAAPALAEPALDTRFKAIESRTGGRLGVWAGRIGGGQTVAWRADERFLMCSTFKALAVSAVLARVDRGQEHLDRWIAYGPADLQEYAPVAKANLAQGGMTLDRTEPTLNRPGPGDDPHDTTTPASMTGLWRAILFGKALSAPSLAKLNSWLEACSTSPNRLKAATPPGWRMGHKTGLGSTTAGDVAFFAPPAGAPILIAVYLEVAGALDNSHDDAFAEVGRLALNHIAGVGVVG